jgi:hypothetical protein
MNRKLIIMARTGDAKENYGESVEKKTNKLITDGETWTEVIIFYEGKV